MKAFAPGVLALLLGHCLTEAMAQDLVPPPSPDKIKRCVEEFDTSKRYRFEWKRVEVGKPRHPQNNFEALGQLDARRDAYGYPIHVIFNLSGFADIDAMYWIIQDAQGGWVIPPLCRMPPPILR